MIKETFNLLNAKHFNEISSPGFAITSPISFKPTIRISTSYRSFGFGIYPGISVIICGPP